MSVSVAGTEGEGARGDAQVVGAEDRSHEIEEGGVSAPSRHIDAATARLDMLARVWMDFQQMRKATFLRQVDECRLCDARRAEPGKRITGQHDRGCLVGELQRIEDSLSRRLSKALRSHDLWPWLSQYPGLGGAHTAGVIGRMGDPRRFPGQRCSEGHYLPPLYAVGSPCPVAVSSVEIDSDRDDGADFGADGFLGALDEASVRRNGAAAGYRDEIEVVLDRCSGLMLPPRPETGVRAVWQWAGLGVEKDGRAPRFRKGVKGHWQPRVRASFMQPGGHCEQIVRQKVPHYYEVYLAAKERLLLRVVGLQPESEERVGGADPGAADGLFESDALGGRPLRRFEADRIARKIAGKAFLGDLLVEWKRIVA